MQTYFADTVFWIAVSRRRDQHHRRALAWQRFLIQSNSKILTTEAVLWEWLNARSDVTTRAIAAEGHRLIHADPQIEVVPFDPELIAAAHEIYRMAKDMNWSLTDCLSFVVMDRRGLKAALTTDRHFEQANLQPIMLKDPLG